MSAVSPPSGTPIETEKARDLETRRPDLGVQRPSRMTRLHGTLEAMEIERDPYAPTPPPGQDQLPYEDGEPMESIRHREQMNLCIHTLEDAWEGRTDFFVGGNMFVYFSELQWKGGHFRGPDVFVVLDTDRTRERKSWVAWEEGGRLPDVVIELLSESTEAVDRGEKKRIYERVWRTGHYVIYDPHGSAFEGWVLDGGRYRPIERDARGDLPIASMGLALGVRPGEDGVPWLRWIDGEGRVLTSGRERAIAERARAQAEKARADDEKARADDEKTRADAEKARADGEKARADGEKARADEAERRLAALEAALAARR